MDDYGRRYKGKINAIIGNHLKRRRQLMGLSQEQLGQMVGERSNITISYWESGKVSIPSHLIPKLYKLLRRENERCITLTKGDIERLLSYRHIYQGQDVVLMDSALAWLYVKPLTEYNGIAVVKIEDAVLHIPSERWYEFRANNNGTTQEDIYKGAVLEDGWTFSKYEIRKGFFSEKYLNLCYNEIMDVMDELIDQSREILKKNGIEETAVLKIIKAIRESNIKELKEIDKELTKLKVLFDKCYFENQQ